jgi:uncharacterized protein YutE (UPF0331/DUF86 family)
VAPDVLARKLGMLRRLLVDLERHRDASLAEVEKHHYEVERILELLATTGSDLMFHLLKEQGSTAGTLRESFHRAGQEGILPADLAARLEKAAGMRNVLVHLYEEIDLTIVHHAVSRALDDFSQLLAHLEARLP